MANDINEKEITVFVDALIHYFVQITGEKADVRTAFLGDGEALPAPHEFTGMIKVSGGYHGFIYFSADRVLLSRLLLILQEPHHTDEQMLDAVGEIANTLAGNVRRHFGEQMEVSVPSTIQHAKSEQFQNMVRSHPYVVTMKWKQYDACVIVDIVRTAK
ncbi:MAG: chemotaxis protein CheX [Burkholderiales bacterium]|jgi:chemotaxis protein CheX|nr:chemotaxis protein CheX [Burkholderiales bacterium]